MRQIYQNEATAARRRVPFDCVSSTDGITNLLTQTFAAADIRVSKAGAAEANSAGTVTEIGGGRYDYEPTVGEVDTLGGWSFRVIKTGMRHFKGYAEIVEAPADSYQAKLWVFDDNAGTADRYVIIWYKNGQPIYTGITSPTINVYKVADGTDLVATTAMTQIGTKGTYRYTEATNRMLNGVAYIAHAEATIAAAIRSWDQPIGRDS